MGQSYQPSNGTEGECFTSEFCDRCRHMPEDTLANDQGYCSILMNAMIYEIKDAEYPKEWVYDAAGYGKCTAFKIKENL